MAIYTQDQMLLKEMVDHYLGRELLSQEHLLKFDCGYDRQRWQSLVEMGWLSAGFPSSVGGLDGDSVEMSIVMEGVGRGLMREPFMSVMLSGVVLLACNDTATDGLSEKIELILSGTHQVSLAFQKKGMRFDKLDCSTVVTNSELGFRLSGSKTLVLNGGDAQEYIVTAFTDVAGDKAELMLFLVSADAPGVTVKPYELMDKHQAADVDFDNVELSTKQLLARGTDAEKILQYTLDYAVLMASAEGLGLATRLLDQTNEYIKTRKQFGSTLSSFQVLQHRMSDLYAACSEARSLVWMLAQTMQRNTEDRQQLVSATKVGVMDRAMLIAREAIQLHGGMGMTEELSVGAGFKRVKTLQILFGDAAYHYSQLINQSV